MLEDKRNWIDDILAECEIVETPRSWLYWSLVAAISAAAGNNYYLKALHGAVTYKANLYVILLGPPGLGKAFGVNLAEGLVRKADITRVIAGRSSIQAIITELSKAVTREKKGPIMDSRAFITAGELSTAIIKDPMALTNLTDLYDCREVWENNLKMNDSKEKLKNNYITFLAGSSEAHFRDSIPEVNIEGGLISRTLIVQEESRYKDLDLLTDESEELELKEKIIAAYTPHLETIASGGGRLIPDLDAKKIFNDWRRQWRAEQVGREDVSGFMNRVPDHVLKTAMCLCLAEYDGRLVIDRYHIEEAISRIVPLTYSVKKTTEGLGDNPLSTQIKLVLDFLLAAPNHELKRKQLLVKGYGHYDSTMLDTVISTLQEMDWIKKERYVAGKASDWIIQLQGEPLEHYRKFIEARRNKSELKVVIGGNK